MNYSKQYISNLGAETNFIHGNLEKVLRLLDVLSFLFSGSAFSESLCLKGGTAINLVHTRLKRLSVDIDLDYHGSLDKTKAFEDRATIERELDSFMAKEGYETSPKSRSSVALLSKVYRYYNAFGNLDNIKVEINFMDRISLYGSQNEMVAYFGKMIEVIVPKKEELFGMKLAALINRSKPRDLYDGLELVKSIERHDKTLLKKALIFYLSLDGVPFVDDSVFDGIKGISESSIKKELLPVLPKGERFNNREAIETIVAFLKQLLDLNENEREYLLELSKGNYMPGLLFEGVCSERIADHPMAKWRALKAKA